MGEQKNLKEHALATWALWGLLSAIVLAGILSVYVERFDVVAFIAAASTFSIAVLTVAYVKVTTGQLSVMRNQLSEMAKARELGAQPFPAIEIRRIFLERPNFFYTPPEKSYSANPRLYVEYRIINHGNVPAVGTVPAALVLFGERGEKEQMDGGARHLSILGPLEAFPNAEGDYFSFSGDKHNLLLNYLVDRSYRHPPAFSVRTIYKNVLGGCFANTWVFEISPKDDEDFEVLTNWRSRLASFDIDFGDELERLKKLKGKDDEKWDELFSQVRDRFAKSLEGGDELDLAFVELPNTFSVEVITAEQYKKEVSHRRFGRPIPKWMTRCLSE